MISRRLVRIKTLQSLYAWQQSGDDSVDKGKNSLAENLLRPYDAYLYLLEFPIAFQQFLDSEVTAEKAKYFPDQIRIRDCQMLHNNSVALLLFNQARSIKRRYLNAYWESAAEQFENLFNELRECDFVRDHLVFDQPNLDQEKLFLENLFQYLSNASEHFHGIMEDVYPAWNDDEESLIREVIKTIASAKNSQELRLVSRPVLQDEDVDYGLKLFVHVAENEAYFESLIRDVTDNWDPTRIAILDLIAIKMAIAEYLYCPEIPVKVTINEYLDIIKDYSTPGSSRFLNGILDKLRKKLETDGTIQKSGRGLRDR
jgi:N utilization substance protein B